MTEQYRLSQPLFGGVEINEYRPKLQQNYDKNGNIYYTDENGEVVAPHKLPYMERLGRKVRAFGTNLGSWLNNTGNEAIQQEKLGLITGLLTLPFGGEGFAASRIGTGLLGKLTPFMGKKIAQNVVQDMGAGGASGLVEGGIRGIAEGENPVKTALQDGAIGLLGGGGIGLGIGKFGQGLARRGLQDAANREQYLNDYIEGLAHPQRAMADFRKAWAKQETPPFAPAFWKGEARTVFDIPGNKNIKNFSFNQEELPRSLKNRYFIDTIEPENIDPDLLPFLKRNEKRGVNAYFTKDGYVNSGQYNGKWTKPAIDKAIGSYNDDFNKKVINEFINTDKVKNFHKNTELEFNVKPLSEIKKEIQFYKSPVYNGRQSSSYSVALDNDGNIYYKRKSNHWGNFHTNVYADDFIKENQAAFNEFLKKNPGATENDFLESLGYDTSDVYGRIGYKSHHWNLNGGNVNAKNSQSGYIKIGNVKDSELYKKLVKNSDEEFDYNKAKQLVKDLKSGKNNPLKNTENSVKIKNVEGISKSDMDYLTHELNNNLSKKERTKKTIKKPVGDGIYKVKNNGFNEYEFIERKPIDDIYN